MEKLYNYTDAFNELQKIVNDIETGDTNVDELAVRIKRASDLIDICKAKLYASEEEVERLLNQLSIQDQSEEEE